MSRYTSKARFGRFEVLSRIGFGGMGEVFRARMQGRSGPDVALKLMRPECASDARLREMFLAEVRICSILNHPNITRLVDFGDVDGVLYLATELVDGIGLDRLLSASASASAIPLDLTAHIIDSLLEALDYAHQLADASGRPLGLVHRDVSSSNVLLSRTGEVKLADFGVHKVAGQVMTLPGELKGKPAFMAPEQLGGGSSVNARADLFAVGVLLHRLAIGTPPFIDVASWLANGAPMTAAGPLHDLITLALAPDPSHRVSSAREFRQTLRRVVVPSNQAARELGRRVSELASGERPLSAMERVIMSELEPQEASGLIYAPDPSTGRLWILAEEGEGETIIDPAPTRPVRPPPGMVFDMTPTEPYHDGSSMDSFPTPPLARPAMQRMELSDTVTTSQSEPLLLEELGSAPRVLPRPQPRLSPRVVLIAGGAIAAAMALGYAFRPAPAPLLPEETSVTVAQPPSPAPPVPSETATPPATAPATPPAATPPAATPPATTPPAATPPAATPPAATPPPAEAAADDHGATDAIPAPVAPAAHAPRTTPRPARPAPEPPAGYLTLDTEPWAVVYLGSRPIGTTPFMRVPLPSGRRQLTFDLQGSGQRVRRMVEIPPGGLKRLTLQLR